MLPQLFALVSGVLGNVFLLFGYVTNESSFPQPLTPEEEQECLEQLRNGSEEARNTLISRNLRLVAHIVKNYNSTGIDTDDLNSIGSIGLMKAVNSYDQDKGTRFATYAAKCIANEILMYLRTLSKRRNEVSLQDTIGTDKDGNETTYMDIIGTDPEAIVDMVEQNIETRRMYSKVNSILKGREKSIIAMRYGLFNKQARTQSEIARLFGISRSYVSRIEKKAIQKLFKELNQEACN